MFGGALLLNYYYKYMIAEYLVLTASVATFTLIWRAILLDHKDFAKKIESLPIVGGALYCGFCASLWFTFFAVCMYNPVTVFTSPVMSFATGWLTVGAGVLFLRNAIAVLMEANGVLTDMHRTQHKD